MLRFLLLTILWSGSVVSAQAQEAVVTDAKVSFFVPAHSDDKAETTAITVTLYTDSGKRVAILDRCCGNIRYPDNGYTSATYQLDMKNDIRKEEIREGYFDMHIDVAGKEKWTFIPTFQIYFSDGTKATIKGEVLNTVYAKKTLSKIKPDARFGFHL
jgi:hypothetical protein